MYESFFGLHRRPFSATPDPGCAYQSGPIQTVIDELVVCLERGEGIAVLTAPAGLGKTLLCERVKQELGAGFVTILLRHAHFSNRADLLRTLLAELGRSPAAATEHEARLQVLATIADLRRQGQLVAVICDEAHQLSGTLLEELRQLVDHADHGVSWVRLLLSGQLELEELLAGPELSALNQRLRSHVTLSPFTSAEARDYVDYRITWAGGRIEEVFHPDTLTEIVTAADGVPRCLNQLCDHVLLLAYVAEQRPARLELVREALADLKHLPLNWNLRSVREPDASLLESSSPCFPETPASEPAVEFGSHLSAWESSPTFSASEAIDDGNVTEPTVWEFGAEAVAEESVLPVEETPPPLDAFENFLQKVEAELEILEAGAATTVMSVEPPTDDVEEEPVVDRYAAIDAGWPEPSVPALEDSAAETSDERPAARPSISVPVDYPPSQSRTAAVPSIALPQEEIGSEAERQIHTDVLELLSAASDAFGTRRLDDGPSHQHAPLIEDLPAEVLETPPPRVSPNRPFRNLFTRLRRKQQGLGD